MRKICFAVAILCSCFVFSQDLGISELEKIVDEAENRGNVGARSHITQYWQLADLYLDNKDYNKAYAVILRGLQLDPWNYKYQKTAAGIETMNGEYEKAYNRLNFVINNLRDLALIYEESIAARGGINIDNLAGDSLYLPDYYVYIATFPNLDSDVIDLLAAKISEEYGIEVKTVNIGLDESEVNIRDQRLDIYNQILADVRSRYPAEAINDFLRQIGLSQKDLEGREGKRIFTYSLLNQNEAGRQQWQLIEMTKSQYSADSLLKQLSDRLKNYNNDKYCLGVLGVTNKDIYENDYNYLFGWAQKKWGVISYARFLLDGPAGKQFEKRAVMQALSSVGFVIGISRCTNPNCARAYPNSLEEMDRKNPELCDECKANLRKLYLTLK